MTRSVDGVVGLINHSWTAARQPGPPWVSISGLGGHIYFELGAPWLKLDNGTSERTISFEPDQKGLVPMVREFRDSIAQGREPLTSGAVGIDDLSVVLKAYESIEQGVGIPPGLNFFICRSSLVSPPAATALSNGKGFSEW